MAEVVFGTSGSTGDSKPIVRTEESLMMDAESLVKGFPEIWSSRPAVVASVRPEHMYGALWRVRAPRVAGCEVYPSTVFSVEELAESCRRYGRVLFVTTPSFLEKAMLHPDFASLKGAFAAIVTSGSLLRGETSLAVAEAVGACPLEIFGSTETGTVASRVRARGEEWTLFPGVSASLSAKGTIIVDSPFAMKRPFEMSDMVRFVSADRFVLLGRSDRRVKILEKYVSLAASEKALLEHPFVERVRVEAFGDAVPRLGALIVLSPEGRAALAASSFAEVSLRLRHDLLSGMDETAFPRRIRYVRELPANEQGKTTVAAVRAALASWCQEPVVLGWSATDDGLSARLAFPPDMECFKGHFPGYAVLPGVAQLYFVRHFARQVFSDFPEIATYRRLKFQKIVTPRRVVDLTMKRRGAECFEFAIKGETGPCSSGIVERSA